MYPVCAPLFAQQNLPTKMVCHCLLVETDQGLVLIDTGLGVQDYLHPTARLGHFITQFARIENHLELTAIAQIQRLGFSSQDVRHILVSHLDFDHAGGISDFPNATVHVLASEYNATQNVFSLKNKTRYRAQQFRQHRYWNFIEANQGDAWFNLHKVQNFDLFQNEILMIPLLGHSQGHCGIAIKKQEGWLFFCGDAYYSHLQLQPKNKLRRLNKFEQFFAENNEMRLNNLHKIQQLAQNEKNIELICAHDPIELARYLP